MKSGAYGSSRPSWLLLVGLIAIFLCAQFLQQYCDRGFPAKFGRLSFFQEKPTDDTPGN